MEMDLDSFVATLEVVTNRNEYENEKRETAKRNAAIMREVIGRADV